MYASNTALHLFILQQVVFCSCLVLKDVLGQKIPSD